MGNYGLTSLLKTFGLMWMIMIVTLRVLSRANEHRRLLDVTTTTAMFSSFHLQKITKKIKMYALLVNMNPWRVIFLFIHKRYNVWNAWNVCMRGPNSNKPIFDTSDVFCVQGVKVCLNYTKKINHRKIALHCRARLNYSQQVLIFSR